MARKLTVLRQIVTELGTVFTGISAWKEIYLAPKIMAVPSMAPLEIQVCEGSSVYPEHDGSCRSEDFLVLVGIFRKYRLDSGERHSKALADLSLSIYNLKETVIDILDGKFLNDLLDRPLIVQTETAVTEPAANQLLKTISFIAGLNTEMT